MKNEDEGVLAVRTVRKQISAEFDHDPDKLIKHYLAEQERYQDRLLQPASHDRNSASDGSSKN